MNLGLASDGTNLVPDCVSPFGACVAVIGLLVAVGFFGFVAADLSVALWRYWFQ